MKLKDYLTVHRDSAALIREAAAIRWAIEHFRGDTDRSVRDNVAALHEANNRLVEMQQQILERLTTLDGDQELKEASKR